MRLSRFSYVFVFLSAAANEYNGDEDNKPAIIVVAEEGIQAAHTLNLPSLPYYAYVKEVLICKPSKYILEKRVKLHKLSKKDIDNGQKFWYNALE